MKKSTNSIEESDNAKRWTANGRGVMYIEEEML